jgi:hypothetical protein
MIFLRIWKWFNNGFLKMAQTARQRELRHQYALLF